MAAMLSRKASSGALCAASGVARSSRPRADAAIGPAVKRMRRISEPSGAAPPLRDHRMSRRSGMDAVGGPVLRVDLSRQVVEHPLERNERRSRSVGDALGRGPTLVEFRKPLVV